MSNGVVRTMENKIKTGKPLLLNLFGENKSIEVMDFLLMGKGYDFTISHISKGSGVSRTVVYKTISSLKDVGIIEETREKYYRLKNENSKVKHLVKLYKELQEEINRLINYTKPR